MHWLICLPLCCGLLSAIHSNVNLYSFWCLGIQNCLHSALQYGKINSSMTAIRVVAPNGINRNMSILIIIVFSLGEDVFALFISPEEVFKTLISSWESAPTCLAWNKSVYK